MSWRVLNISNPCKLSVKNSQLLHEPQEGGATTLPLEDISVIILENSQIILTNYLLAQLAEYNIVLFSCDSKHIPAGTYIPFCQHSRNAEVAFLQSEWSEPFKKRIWQQIIKQKIINQSSVLESLKGYNELSYLVDKVQSGDSTNVESFSARIYWNTLFDDFKRHNEDKKNSALNYGYAILRGIIARFIAATGFIPCFGLHHSNNLNAFNLADDIIEPFRPFVDKTVFKIFEDQEYEDENLSKEDKIKLLQILNQQCIYKGEQISLLKACEKVCFSLVNSTKAKDYNNFELPSFIEGNKYEH